MGWLFEFLMEIIGRFDWWSARAEDRSRVGESRLDRQAKQFGRWFVIGVAVVGGIWLFVHRGSK
jgi:nicotinamide riboside transporter PnuC